MLRSRQPALGTTDAACTRGDNHETRQPYARRRDVTGARETNGDGTTDDLPRPPSQAQGDTALPDDRALLAKAEEVLTQLHLRVGLDAAQAGVLTALRVRLEGRRRASLDDLLAASGTGGSSAPLHDLATPREDPSCRAKDAFERLAEDVSKRPRLRLDDLLDPPAP